MATVTTPSDLATWMRSQLDADEAVARALLAEHPMRDWESYISDAGHYEGNASAFAQLNHPARVLDQIAAVRRLIDLRDSWASEVERYAGAPDDPVTLVLATQLITANTFIRTLAQPYAGRAGWDDRWAL